MANSYHCITPELAKKIKLVMTDVDGTITSGKPVFAPVVIDSLRRLQEHGIIVGLVSGRELGHLERFAIELNINGPLIAENGAVARMKRESELVDLGYSQEPARRALEKLNKLFPGAIEAREEWNKSRMIDLLFRRQGVSIEELNKHLEDTDILDSGYVFHLVQRGISKGRTLKRIIAKMDGVTISPDEVMVFGDAPTDLSLFQSFPLSVLVVNPDIPVEQGIMLRESARFISDACCDEGFVQVVAHVISVRDGKG